MRCTRRLAVAVLVATGTLSVAAQTPQAPPAGMETYYVGLFKRGPKWTPEKRSATEEVQKGHLASMERRWREGTLVGAGPVVDDGDVRGVLIIKAADLVAARAVAEDDPAVASGRLSVDLHTWWGPAGIGRVYREERAADAAAKDRMKTYQLAFLKRGPAWTPDQGPELVALQQRHLAHIRAMAAAGRLVAAGPFADGGDIRGVFVFDATAEQARALASEDPAVKAGRLALEFHPWMVAEGVLPAAARP